MEREAFWLPSITVFNFTYFLHAKSIFIHMNNSILINSVWHMYILCVYKQLNVKTVPVIWCQVFLFNTKNCHAVVQFLVFLIFPLLYSFKYFSHAKKKKKIPITKCQVFLSYKNNFSTVKLLQVFFCHAKIFPITKCQVFLSYKNNFSTVILLQVFFCHAKKFTIIKCQVFLSYKNNFSTVILLQVFFCHAKKFPI